MDFTLSKEHLLFRQMVREFVENEIKPIMQDIDEEERFPKEVWEKLGPTGLLGIQYPKKYGGHGGDYLAYVMAIEEISKYCASVTSGIAAHSSLCCWPIYQFGTEEQKMRFLPELLSGKAIGAMGLTEPGAGSDSAAQQTKAYLDGDHYVVNGRKCFITNAGEAKYYTTVVMTDKSKGNKGMSILVIPADAPGFTIGKHEKKMGIRASATADLIFDNCIVPKENLIGKEGDGFKMIMQTLDIGRIGVGAVGLGIAEGALEETLKYVSQRKQFGKTIGSFQNTQFEIADMKTRVDSAQLIIYRAACTKDAGLPFGLYACMGKYYGATVGSDITRRCVQLFGGYGYMREYHVERMMRDAKIVEIYEGTSEIQKMVIAGHLKVGK